MYFETVTALNGGDLIQVIAEPGGKDAKRVGITKDDFIRSLGLPLITNKAGGLEINNLNIVNTTSTGLINFTGDSAGLSWGPSYLIDKSGSSIQVRGIASVVKLDLQGTTPEFMINSTKVVGARETGWTAGSGTPNKGAFAADTATAAQAAQRVLALEQALRTHGLIS